MYLKIKLKGINLVPSLLWTDFEKSIFKSFLLKTIDIIDIIYICKQQ